MELKKQLKEFDNLPRFKDGRINYSNSSKALVLICVIKFKDKVLLLRRSNKVSNYRGKWNFLSGFVDDEKPIINKVREEVKEEIGIDIDQDSDIKIKKIWKKHDPSIKKTWIVIPVLIELNENPKIRLDWENSEYKWINPSDIRNYDRVFGLEEDLSHALVKNPISIN